MMYIIAVVKYNCSEIDNAAETIAEVIVFLLKGLQDGN